MDTAVEAGFSSGRRVIACTGSNARFCQATIEELLEMGLEYLEPYEDVNSVMQEIFGGFRQFWIIDDVGVGPVLGMLTHIAHYSRRKTLVITWMGGVKLPEKDEIDHILLGLEYFAIKQGAVELEAKCRPGVGRFLKAFGFKQDAVYVHKSLDMKRVLS